MELEGIKEYEDGFGGWRLKRGGENRREMSSGITTPNIYLYSRPIFLFLLDCWKKKKKLLTQLIFTYFFSPTLSKIWS